MKIRQAKKIVSCMLNGRRWVRKKRQDESYFRAVHIAWRHRKWYLRQCAEHTAKVFEKALSRLQG